MNKGILILLSFLFFITELFGQPPVIYNGISLQAGSSTNGVPVLPFVINSSNGSVSFEAENEIVLGPDCSPYVNCVSSNNYFYTSGFDISGSGNNFFIAKLIPPRVYSELKELLDGDYEVSQQERLFFKYIEKYNEGPLDYQIYDFQRNPKITTKTLTKKVGTNFYILDLKLLANMINGDYYTLEVLNDKGEKMMLRFKYKADY